MSTPLSWVAPQAPYMPVAVAGLLLAHELAGISARAGWATEHGRSRLQVKTELSCSELAALLVDGPWPTLSRIQMPAGAPAKSQAIKPVLAACQQPAVAFREMISNAEGIDSIFLSALLTDGALDDKGVPSRSRLLRGVKADLSGVANRPRRIDIDALAGELEHGPRFVKGSSGLGLGLVPEIQTFGGTTGPDASTVGAYSPLLYLLLWLGVMALPPVAVDRGPRVAVGGPLITAADVLSWPVWGSLVGLRGLRSLFSLDAIHAEEPERRILEPRGISAVYRARAVELSTMVAVFRWGRQVLR